VIQTTLTDKIYSWIKNDYLVLLKRKNRLGNSIEDKQKSGLLGIKNEISGKSIEINTGKKNSPQWASRNPSDYIDYIEKIEELYEELLVLRPSEFDAKISEFESIISREEIDLPIRLDGTPAGSFADIIVDALCYTSIRDSVAPRFFKALNIRSCVYCNANYAITDANGDAYYDLDHWKPKALYPYLSASFFNFQPSCPSCNRRKSNKDNDIKKGQVFFHIWDETGVPSEALRFELSRLSLVKYLVYHDSEDLSVSLQDASGTRSGRTLCTTAENTFHINGRYHEHNDYLEEIIWKSQVYNPSGLKALEQVLGNTLPKYVDPLRFILGNYIAPEDTHKRPLSKLTQDIAKQLSLIP